MTQEKPEEVWPAISDEERTLHEILFYSQGPVDGYILGEGIRDLLLKSGLSLTILSQIWNLADVSNDNVLNVDEFVLIMHLIRGVMSGRAVPKALPRSLTPPKSVPQTPPPMTQQEKDAYLRVFQTLDYNRTGFINAQIAAEVLLATQLPVDVLAHIWDLSEFSRDGKLNPEKFAIACHLLRYAKKGGSLDGPVDIFQYAPQYVSPLSLLARKRRVSEYEEHKQRLMSLKERRKVQALRETRRLDLAKTKLTCLQNLFELLKTLGKESAADEYLQKIIAKDKTDNEKQEEIALRLKKEHEKVRQETVKIILGEQKFNNDISIIKKDTDELNKRLLSAYTHATKDPDPFHQLFEQRREKRQGSTIKDLDKIDIHIPFEFSPFDLSITPKTLPSGMDIINKGDNHQPPMAEIKSVIADLKEFGENFMDLWGEMVPLSKHKPNEFEDDEIFQEVHDWSDENWPTWDWSEVGLLGLTEPEIIKIKEELCDLREELNKLNSGAGRLVFRNSSDYYARKKAIEEEEKVEKGRVERRSVTERLRSGKSSSHRTRDATNRYSYSGERKANTTISQAAIAAREYRLKRRSQTFDSASSSPEIVRNRDREKRLYRTQTDPASVSDEGSLSRESSISSFDHPSSLVGSSPKLEEESSTIRTQYSSKTNDSGILTFVSTDRKDNFCLDSPLELLHPSKAESYDTSTKITDLGADGKLPHPYLKDTSSLSSVAVEVHQYKEEDSHHAGQSTSTDSSGCQEITRRSSKKHKAPSPPCNTSPAAPFSDKTAKAQVHSHSEILTNVEVNEGKYNSHKNIEVTIDSTEHSDIGTRLTEANLEVKEITRLSGTEQTPQRPPRLKKRTSSERSYDLPSPTNTVAVDPISNVKESVSVVTSDPFSAELKSKESHFSESPSKAYEVTSVQKQIITRQTSLDNNVKSEKSLASLSFDNTLPKISKTGADFDENKQEQIKSEITSLPSTYNSNRSLEALTNTTSKETASENMATQIETMIQFSQSSVITSTTETINKHIFSNCSEEQIPGDDAVTNFRFDAGRDGSPPPLPSSAPPPLPTEPPPTVENNEEIEEEIITVEYSVPIIPGSKSFEDNTPSETRDQVDSSVHVNRLTKTRVNDSGPSTIMTSRNVSIPDDRADNEPQIESQATLKTISDLRSDFFGVKSRRTPKDVIEPDLTDTPASLSHDFYFTDVQAEDKLSRKPGLENSVDSDTSDGDSCVPLSVADDTFSPGNSGHFTMSTTATPDENSGSKPSFISTERRNEVSNKSADSGFDDNIAVAPVSSAKETKPPPANLNDSKTTPKKQAQNISNQERTTRSPALPGSPTPSAESISSSATSKSFTRMGSSDKTENAQTKKTTTIKKEVIVTSAGDILPELQLERLDAMAQSRVKRKVNVSLPAADEIETVQEVVNSPVSSSLKKSNPSEYGFVYSADRPQPAPEAGWTEKPTSVQKVSLYSENVLKEGETTESVDRASIANLETTKKQWEHIFTTSPIQVDASVKKKTTPKWEVRLPYSERHSASSPNQGQHLDNPSSSDNFEEEDSNMFKKPVTTESAIEREIRLAHEREEMLRREKEEREKLVQQQKTHGQNLMASYVTSSAESESNQPAFHELAEADRNPDLWRAEHEDESEGNSIVNPNESIIEREIRLQREREAEFARMRKLPQPELQQQEQPALAQSQHPHTPHMEKEDINHNQTKTASHRDPVARSSNEVENRIVRELQELREREEEIKRLHTSLHRTQITDENEVDEIDGMEEASQYSSSVASFQGVSQTDGPSSQVSWQRDVSSFLIPLRRESVDSISSQSTGRSPSDIIPSRRDVKVRPIADSYNDEEVEKTDYFKKQETPIEREIRLARERENELRKQKGLPEIDAKEENTYSSYSGIQEPSSNISAYKPHSVPSDDSMKKFASSRLQQELQEQKERELALLSEGKIITTSEQHIPPLKYMEVSGPEKSDGTLKRNFTTKKSGVSYNEPDLPQRQQSREPTTPTAASTKRTSTVGAGGQLFSYREFRQTAESKIERELREMKEREEELRKQRSGAIPESPH